uniref:Uncharacterized protein n=1 Tax=Timema shepardi TaxID=629360 RepID=A0A7R9G692_TIMSH|nr:unnamed protein product [Timema shepardi]
MASLREQLSAFQNQNTSELNSTSVVEEILELKNKNSALSKSVDTLKEKLSLTENERLVLYHKYDAVNKELDMAMDNLTAKKEELNSANANMTALQEELVMLRVELDGAKMLQKPSERGNSLFGEVDDYRKRLQSRLDSANQTNKQLKRQLAVIRNEMSKLKAEKVFLCSEFKSVEEGCKKFDNLHVESYKIRIQELQERVKELERLKLPQVRVLSGGKGEDLSWVENLVEGERAEARKLRAALEEKSFAQLIESDSLHRVQRELQVVKAQLMQARAHNITLQLEAQEGGTFTPHKP